MNIWPLSRIATEMSNGVVQASVANDLSGVLRHRAGSMSPETMQACLHAAQRVSAVETQCELVENVGGMISAVYREYPTFDEWMALERAFICENHRGCYMIVSPLH